MMLKNPTIHIFKSLLKSLGRLFLRKIIGKISPFLLMFLLKAKAIIC